MPASTEEEAYAKQQATGDLLAAAGIDVVELPITELPPRLDILPALTNGYRIALNAFLADLGEDAPVTSLEEIIAYNNGDPANRMPYGQGHLEESQAGEMRAAEFAALADANRTAARDAIDGLFEAHAIDVIVSDLNQLYAPAGYPALTVPSGYGPDGAPENLVLVGRYLAEPALLAVGYAYEQTADARVAPDLDAWQAPD